MSGNDMDMSCVKCGFEWTGHAIEDCPMCSDDEPEGSNSFQSLLNGYALKGGFASPDYYKHNGIDAKDLMQGLDYWKGSAISHILRAGKKAGETEQEALQNAVICLLRRLEELEEE